MAEEKLFEGKIKKWFHSVGIYPAGFDENKMEVEQVGWYTKIWGGGYQKAGIPDIIACVKGQFVSIEVKASNGRASDLQKLNTNRIRDSGGHGIFLYPTGFEQFKEDLTTMMDALKYDSYAPRMKGVYK
ncbi:MAG: hypothetical protein ACOX1S_10435 [Anaerostipes sp.]|jgi:hypothetical protein